MSVAINIVKDMLRVPNAMESGNTWMHVKTLYGAARNVLGPRDFFFYALSVRIERALLDMGEMGLRSTQVDTIRTLLALEAANADQPKHMSPELNVTNTACAAMYNTALCYPDLDVPIYSLAYMLRLAVANSITLFPITYMYKNHMYPADAHKKHAYPTIVSNTHLPDFYLDVSAYISPLGRRSGTSNITILGKQHAAQIRPLYTHLGYMGLIPTRLYLDITRRAMEFYRHLAANPSTDNNIRVSPIAQALLQLDGIDEVLNIPHPWLPYEYVTTLPLIELVKASGDPFLYTYAWMHAVDEGVHTS